MNLLMQFAQLGCRIFCHMSALIVLLVVGTSVLFPSLGPTVSKELLCTEIGQKPCQYSKAAIESSGPFLLQPNLSKLSSKTIEAVDRLASEQIQKNSFTEKFKAELLKLSPEIQIRCLSAVFVVFALRLSEDQIEKHNITRRTGDQSCPDEARMKLLEILKNPIEGDHPNFEILQNIYPKIQEEVSSATDKKVLEIFREVKNQYISFLKARRTPKPFLQLVEKARYEKTICLSSKDWARIELASKNVVYACQGFTWTPITTTLLAWTIAHELGHILDACDLARQGLLKFKTDTTNSELALKNHPLKDLYQIAKEKIVDAPSAPPNTEFCDQRNWFEAFADAVAGEIAPEVIKKLNASSLPLQGREDEIRNSYFSMGARVCKTELEGGEDSVPSLSIHPQGSSRMNYFLGLPNVKPSLRCEKSSQLQDGSSK